MSIASKPSLPAMKRCPDVARNLRYGVFADEVVLAVPASPVAAPSGPREALRLRGFESNKKSMGPALWNKFQKQVPCPIETCVHAQLR